MIETWRPIPSWENFYEVSDLGRVRSLTRTIVVPNPQGVLAPRAYQSRVLRPGVTKKGYPMVSLTAPGRPREYRYVHDLVTATFLGPRPPGTEVCHFDGECVNNALSNLRYDTRSANAMDRHRHGTMNQPKGEACVPAKLTDTAVRRIRALRPFVTLQTLADEYGVSTTTISMAEHRKTWGHVA